MPNHDGWTYEVGQLHAGVAEYTWLVRDANGNTVASWASNAHVVGEGDEARTVGYVLFPSVDAALEAITGRWPGIVDHHTYTPGSAEAEAESRAQLAVAAFNEIGA